MSTKLTTKLIGKGLFEEYHTIQRLYRLLGFTYVAFVFIDSSAAILNGKFGLVGWINLLLGLLFTVGFFGIKLLSQNEDYSFIPDFFYNVFLLVAAVSAGINVTAYVILLSFLVIITSLAHKSSFLFVLSTIESLIAFTIYYLLSTSLVGPEQVANFLYILLGASFFSFVIRVITIEITKLRRRHEELEFKAREISAERNQIYNLINSIDDGIIAVDGGQNITFANDRAVQILKAPTGSDNLLGENVNSHFKTISEEEMISLFTEIAKAKKPIHRDDLHLITKTGSLRIYISVTPIADEHGKNVGSIALFRDITTEKELEEQREEFNAIASHELRTPLTIIDGYVYNLKSDKSLKYDQKTAKYIDEVSAATTSLIKLTNDILAVTRAERHQYKFNIANTNIGTLVKTAISQQKAKAKIKKLKLEAEIPNNLPLVVTDGEKILEVLNNLIENAIKFTDKGEITVNIGVDNKQAIVVRITDTGIGIDKSDQGKIFTKFYRTEDWQTRKTGGTGLGLYISKTYINILGGKIGVESVRGKGSTFWFNLPLTREKTRRRTTGEKQLGDFVKSI